MSIRWQTIVAVVAIIEVALAPRAHAAADAKTVVKCQATLQKAGATFIAKKLGALGKCADGVFKCIQTVDESGDAGAKRTACIVKARGGCLKSLAGITAARTAFTGAASSACNALDAAQVTDASALGYSDVDCAGFGVTVSDVATLATCLAKQHDCEASRMFHLGVPRARELLQFTPPDAVVVPAADAGALDCLASNAGTGADVNDVALGKSLIKCEKAVEKVGGKLASGRLKTLAKCVDALFACAATKTGDDLVKCRGKARAGCAKAFDKGQGKDTGLADSLSKPCGDPAVFAALLAPEGGDFQSLVPAIVARPAPLGGCFPLATITDFETCLLTQSADQVASLIAFESPTADDLLAAVNCDLDSCGPPPTPQPTATPLPTATPSNGATSGATATTQPTATGPSPAKTPTIDDFIFFDDADPNGINHPAGIASDGNGNCYVTGVDSDNAFEIAADDTITLLANADSDFDFFSPLPIAVDGANVYVATGADVVFKIAAGTLTPILDGDGDGTHGIGDIRALAIGADHSVYAAGFFSDDVIKVTPQGGKSAIIGPSGDGTHSLSGPIGLAVDNAGRVFIAGKVSNNVFRYDPNGPTITRIADGTGAGGHALSSPRALAVDRTTGTVYVPSALSDVVFKIPLGGSPQVIIDSSGDGHGNTLDTPTAVALDGAGNVYVTGADSENVFKIATDGKITLILDNDIAQDFFIDPEAIAADPDGTIYVAGRGSLNVFRIKP